MEQETRRDYEASPQSGLDVGSKIFSSSEGCAEQMHFFLDDFT